MPTIIKCPTPPSHLTPATKAWFRSVAATYVLEPHHVRLLTLAGEAFDRAQQAREILAREGLTVPTGDGGIKAHPCVAIERDARIAFARLVRDLDLDAEPPQPNGRPPRPVGIGLEAVP